MAKDELAERPLTSTLRAFGAVRLWASVVVGALVVVTAVTVFTLSYAWEANYVQTVGEVVRVDCGEVRRVDGDRVASTSLVYEEGYEPKSGDQLALFYDRDDPTKIAQDKITDEQRATARVIAGIVGGIALVVVVVNVVPMNSKALRTL